MKQFLVCAAISACLLAGATSAKAANDSLRNIRGCAENLCSSMRVQNCSVSVVGKAERVPNTSKQSETTQAPAPTCRTFAAEDFFFCSTFVPQLMGKTTPVANTVKTTTGSTSK